MNYKRDGSPISSNSMALGKHAGGMSDSELESVRNMLGKVIELTLGTIREVRYVDDEENLSQNQIEYKIRIEFGERFGQEYDNVKSYNLFGGVVNFSETVLYPKTDLLKGSTDKNNTKMFEHDASQVIIAFMDGFPNRPYILGSFSHTNFPKGLAAKRADGIRNLQEFNGMRLETNKDGEYILTYYGGRRNTKKLKTDRFNTAPTTFKIDKTGAWSIDDKENQKIKIDRVTKKISLTQSENTKPDETYGLTDNSSPGTLINSVEMDKTDKKITVKAGNTKVTQVWDGTAEKITMTFASGLAITVDGAGDKALIQTAGGSKIDVNGSSGTIIVKDNGTGTLKISGSKVGLGASSAELLDEISKALDKLVTFLNSTDSVHTHIGNLGYPVSPPVETAQFIQLATDLTTIKSKIDGIKGGI